MTLRKVALAVGALALGGSLYADDWPAFRGSAGTGIASEKKAPVTWAPDKNVKWRVELPQWGNGSPIVSKGRVFVTSAEDEGGTKRSLYCFDRKDGKKLWSQTVEYGKRAPTHQTNGYCPTTPAADGERVVWWEGSAGLHCYDFEGKKVWSRDLGEFRHMWGDGASPILHNGRVILNAGPGKKNFVTSIDLATGKTVWEVEEPFQGTGDNNESNKPMGSWCTPFIVKVGGKDQIVCSLPKRVLAYDPADGKVLWSCDGLRFGKGDLVYSSPVVVGDVCVIFGGYNGPGMGIKLGGRGDVTKTHRLWHVDSTANPQSIGSGVAIGGAIYVPYAGANRIDCIDPRTGKAVWQGNAGGGAFWGSIVHAAGLLYVTDQGGTTVVFKASPDKFEMVSKNALGEKSNSTPAISDGQIFLRTHKAIYCIGE